MDILTVTCHVSYVYTILVTMAHLHSQVFFFLNSLFFFGVFWYQAFLFSPRIYIYNDINMIHLQFNLHFNQTLHLINLLNTLDSRFRINISPNVHTIAWLDCQRFVFKFQKTIVCVKNKYHAKDLLV